MNWVAFLGQECCAVLSRIIFDHIKLSVLWVLGEVLLDALRLTKVAKRELFEVVLHAVLVECVRVFGLKLVDEPCVAICGEEKLAWHLVHLMGALDAATLARFQLLLNFVVFVLRTQIHDERSFTQHLVSKSVDV